jgi:hypothetical protein
MISQFCHGMSDSQYRIDDAGPLFHTCFISCVMCDSLVVIGFISSLSVFVFSVDSVSGHLFFGTSLKTQTRCRLRCRVCRHRRIPQ